MALTDVFISPTGALTEINTSFDSAIFFGSVQ